MARPPRKRNRSKTKRTGQQQPAQGNPAPLAVPAQISSTNPVNSAAGQAGVNQQNQQQSGRPRWNDRRLNTWFAGSVALFALAQVVVSYWQWTEMRTTTEQTQQTLALMRLDNRPWMTPATVQLDEPLAAGKPLTFSLKIGNFGHTPAFIKASGYRVACLPAAAELGKEVAELWRTAKTSKRVNSVGPNAMLMLKSQESFIVTEKQLADIYSTDPAARRVLYILYACEYAGPDGGDYGLESCFEYAPALNDFIGHAMHNRMDVPSKERGS